MIRSRRRQFLIAVGALLAKPFAIAQSPAKVPRIGWLTVADAGAGKVAIDAFREGLRALNYVEGRNIVIEYRWGEGNVARLPELARSLVNSNVDVIVAGALFGVQAAKDATSTIPIVAAGVADLAAAGLVASLARPGGNLTGFSVVHPETAGKQIQIMKEILPGARSAAVLWGGPTNEFWKGQRVAVEQAVGPRVSLTWEAPQSLSELESSFVAISKLRPDFLVLLSTGFYFNFRTEIARFAARARVPAIYGFHDFVDAGGLISYGASIPDSFRRAAEYVDRILKGAKPADLPVQLPQKFELVVNLKTAKALGLTIPQSILMRADRVIE